MEAKTKSRSFFIKGFGRPPPHLWYLPPKTTTFWTLPLILIEQSMENERERERERERLDRERKIERRERLLLKGKNRS